VRRAPGLQEVVLYGHSGGSMLAIEYLCQGRGSGVRKLVLAGALASVPQYLAGTRSLLAQMPNHAGERILALDEPAGRTPPSIRGSFRPSMTCMSAVASRCLAKFRRPTIC
jgi:proline iminopeptidase